MSKREGAKAHRYILQRYFNEMPPNKRQRSRSLSVHSNQNDGRIENAEQLHVLSPIALDILSFKSNAMNLTDLLRDYISDIEPFSTSPQHAYRIISGIHHHWNDWSHNFHAVEMEIKRLKDKYSEHAETEENEDCDSNCSDVTANHQLESISSSVLKEMRKTLNSGVALIPETIPAGSKFSSLRNNDVMTESEPEPERNDDEDEESCARSRLSSILGQGGNQTDIISLSSSSGDTIPLQTFAVEKKPEVSDTDVSDVRVGLDLISDDSDNSSRFTLNLSIISSKPSRRHKKKAKKKTNAVDENAMEKRKCYVKISKKEKQLVDDAILKRQATDEQSETETKRTTSSSSDSDLFRKRRRRKRSKSDSSESYVARKIRTNRAKKSPWKRIISSSTSNSDDSADYSDYSNSDGSLVRRTRGGCSSSSTESYRYDDSVSNSDSESFKDNPLDAISDSGSSDISSSTSSSKQAEVKKTKKARKKLQKKKDDTPNRLWRKDPLLTAPLDTDNDRPMSMNESSEESDVEFVPNNVKQSPEQNEPSTSTQGRKNIKQIMSNKDLQQATVDATNAERRRIERLKELYSQRSIHDSQSSEMAGEDSLILDTSDELTIMVDANLSAKMKSHQREGVKFMWDNCFESLERLKKHDDGGSGCILAHCMGMGKTFQVVSLLHTLFKYPQTKVHTVVVICPLTTIQNWKAEFRAAMKLAKSGKDTEIYCMLGGNRTKFSTQSMIRSWQQTGGVLVMAYETFTSVVSKNAMLKPALIDPGADLVICDEGHLLKSGHTNRTKIISMIRSKRRIVLTGTPMQNNLEEYYYMCSFVKPAFFGTYKEFRNRFINPIMNGQYENSDEKDIKLMKKRSHVLHKMTKGFIQRYEVTELYKYLPSMHHYVLKIDLDPLQIDLYKKYIELSKSHMKKLFANYNILRLIWSHPRLLKSQCDAKETFQKNKPAAKKQKMDADLDEVVHIDDAPIAPDWWKADTPAEAFTGVEFGRKFIVMLSILKHCVANNEKLLIFTSSLHALDALEFFIKQQMPTWRAEQQYFRMDGKVPYEVRKRYCTRFNQPTSKVCVFLLTQKVGGLGLNLTAANRVIIMDVSWNPTHDTQSISRIYRLSQSKACYVYRLVAKGTMEEVMFERSVTKQAVAGRIVDELQIHRHFNAAQLCLMYRCVFDSSGARPTPKVPADHLLADLVKTHKFIYTYYDHRELMQNLPDEKLDEDEMRVAWEEYEHEKVAAFNQAQALMNAQAMMSLQSNSKTLGFNIGVVEPPSTSRAGQFTHRPDEFVVLVEGTETKVKMVFDENSKLVPINERVRIANGITDVQLQAAQAIYANRLNPNVLMPPGIYCIDREGFLKDYNDGVVETVATKTSGPENVRKAVPDDDDDDIVWSGPIISNHRVLILKLATSSLLADRMYTVSSSTKITQLHVDTFIKKKLRAHRQHVACTRERLVLKCALSMHTFLSGTNECLSGQKVSHFREKSRARVSRTEALVSRFLARILFARAHHNTDHPFTLKDLSSCSHVFRRIDSIRKPLHPPYSGPHEVVRRLEGNVFIIRINVAEKSVSADALKPAFRQTEDVAQQLEAASPSPSPPAPTARPAGVSFR